MTSKHRSSLSKLQPLQLLEMEAMAMTGTTAVESPTGQERLPSELFRVFQWKYKPDSCKPWWKRWYFHWVYLPFARFSYFKMDVVPFERLEPDGSLSWKEDEGYFYDRWRAEQEAAKYPFGGYNPVAVNATEQDTSCKPRCQFPQSKARGVYVRRGKRSIELEVTPVERLREVVAMADNYRRAHR